MSQRRYGVGIIGLTPGRSWSSLAHLPALRGLSKDFRIVGVASSSTESARSAAKVAGLPRAFDSVGHLVASPDVDIVAVTVKVPHHRDLVTAALAAGKHVYCEWPLGNGLAEARVLADLARDANVLAVAGMQAVFAPEIARLQALLAEGYAGDVLSTTLVATGMWFGASVDSPNVYTLDDGQGATMLTIAVGHALAALEKTLGPVAYLSATLATRRPTALNTDTGETVVRQSADQVLVEGQLQSGAPFSIHYRGGGSRGPGLLWEINGTDGDLRITGPGGHLQLVPLVLSGGRDAADELAPITATAQGDASEGPIVENVRSVYAALASDLRHGTAIAPTFEDAVRTHRVLEAIRQAAASGRRVAL
jgi:predicted dehydrogenase